MVDTQKESQGKFKLGTSNSLSFPQTISQKKHWIQFSMENMKFTNDGVSSGTPSSQGSVSVNKTVLLRDSTITLYHPGIVSSSSTIWSDVETNLYGEFQNKIVGNGKMTTEVAGEIGKRIAEQTALGGTPREMLYKNQGQIANPNLQMFFRGVNFRNFSFTFNFYPESPAEASIVKNIIRAFKRGMLPKAQTSTFMDYPSAWNIIESSKLFSFKPCVLTDVSVSGSPNGIFTTFPDGSPTSLSLSLSFKESEIVVGRDYDDITGWY